MAGAARAGHFLRLWLLFFLAAASWSVMTPLGAVPDETAHVLNAASVARGQLADPLPEVADVASTHSQRVVYLPEVYEELLVMDECYKFRPEVPASCQEPLPEDPGPNVAVPTAAGRYNPTYYAMVGVTSYLPDASAGMFAMRLLSAAWCALFMAWGVRALDRFAHGRALRLGTLVTLTPGVFFIMGGVNPNGVEVAAGFSLWAALLGLVALPGRDASAGSLPAGTPALLVQAGVGAFFVSTMRPIAPVWAAVTVLVCLVIMDRRRLLRLVRTRWFAFPAGLGVLAVLWVVGWQVTRPEPFGSLQTALDPRSVAESLLGIFFWLDDYAVMAVGNYGPADTPSPLLTVALVFGLIGFLVVTALAVGSREAAPRLDGDLRMPRWRLGLLLVLVAMVSVPVVMSVPLWAHHGSLWQGRYTYALQVGIGMLLGLAVASARTTHGPVDWTAVRTFVARSTPWLVSALVLAHAGAYWVSALRWSVGIEWNYVAGGAPPATIALYALRMFAGIAVMAVLVWYVVRERPPHPGERGATAVAEPAALRST